MANYLNAIVQGVDPNVGTRAIAASNALREQSSALMQREQQNALRRNVGNMLARNDLSGARTAAFQGGDIDAGSKIGELMAQHSAQEQKRLGQGIEAAALLTQQGITGQALPGALARLGFDAEEAADLAAIPAEALPGLAQGAKAFFSKGSAEKGFTLSPGQQRYDASGKPIAALSKSEGGADFEDEQKLRKEFTQRQKDFFEQERAFQRVQNSATNPSAAGDLSLIFNYMKVLDPGSVVRESEFATAAAAGAFGDRIQGAVQQVISGRRLSGAQRSDFVNRAKTLFEGAEGLYRRDADFFKDLASQRNIDPDRIINPRRNVSRETSEQQERAQSLRRRPREQLSNTPPVGTIREGRGGIRYRFKGGDHRDRANWEQVQ